MIYQFGFRTSKDPLKNPVLVPPNLKQNKPGYIGKEWAV